MFQVMLSRTFQKQFKALSKDMQKRVRAGLRELEKDPFDPRPNANIKPLKDTTPQKHRLRISEYRIIYFVEGNIVKVIELFKRGRGYRK